MTGKSRASQTPARPLSPASLSSLPAELLTQIAGYLDRPTAISLSLVARKFIAPCESQIWRTIAVGVPPYQAGHPVVQPSAKAGKKKKHPSLSETDAGAAEDKRRAELKEKIKGLMLDVGRKRLGMVETIKITPLPTANIAVLYLLDTLSLHLRSLELSAPDPLLLSEHARPADNEIIDYQMINSGLHFPALTHLRINKHACRFLEILNVLFAAAPELVDLQVDALHESSGPSSSSGGDGMVLDFPPLPKKTKLLRLRYHFETRHQEDEEHHPVIQLVRHSPLLQQADVQTPTGTIPEGLFDALGDLTGLEDLRLPISVFQFTEWRGFSALSIFLRLRRLALCSCIELSLFEDLPKNLPSLEAIYVENGAQRISKMNAITDFPETPSLVCMSPEACAAYRTCPRLAKIYTYDPPCKKVNLSLSDNLDTIEKSSATRIGFIRSLHHANQQLFHARILTYLGEVGDAPPPHVQFDRDLLPINKYCDGSSYQETFAELEEANFIETSDYEGLTVPLDVISRMRRAEGDPLRPWEGRGIAVGDTAWKVLTDWRKGKDKKEDDSEGSEGAENSDSDCESYLIPPWVSC